MKSHTRTNPILGFICLTLLADAAFGQTLSIIRKSDSEFRIDGVAPADTRYVLQTSGNLQDWDDINDEVWGEVQYTFNSTGPTPRFFRLAAWVPLEPITIVVAGDSTAADFVINNSQFCGWGQGFYDYFKPEAQVANFSVPGYGTRRFLTSNEKTKMMAIKPNYVFLQFGVIDAFPCGDPDTCYTTPQEYADNFRAIVQLIRSIDGTPILVTPPVTHQFNGEGRVVPWVPDRCEILRSLALELQTPLIDLNQSMTDLLNRLGESGSEYLFSGYPGDVGHFSFEGARVIAGLVVDALPKSLRPYVVSGVGASLSP